MVDRLGDRRSGVRLEVVGALGANLELIEHARVVDINRLGALVACTFPPEVDSSPVVQLVFGGFEFRVTARVRHFRVADHAPETGYLVGLEFVSSPAQLDDAIEQFVLSSGQA
jgi:hypothetical protein